MVKAALEKARLAELQSHDMSDVELRKEIVTEIIKLKPLLDQHQTAVNNLAKSPQDVAGKETVIESAKLIGEWSEIIKVLLNDSEYTFQVLQLAAARGDQVLYDLFL